MDGSNLKKRVSWADLAPPRRVLRELGSNFNSSSDSCGQTSSTSISSICGIISGGLGLQCENPRQSLHKPGQELTRVHPATGGEAFLPSGQPHHSHNHGHDSSGKTARRPDSPLPRTSAGSLGGTAARTSAALGDTHIHSHGRWAHRRQQSPPQPHPSQHQWRTPAPTAMVERARRFSCGGVGPSGRPESAGARGARQDSPQLTVSHPAIGLACVSAVGQAACAARRPAVPPSTPVPNPTPRARRRYVCEEPQPRRWQSPIPRPRQAAPLDPLAGSPGPLSPATAGIDSRGRSPSPSPRPPSRGSARAKQWPAPPGPDDGRFTGAPVGPAGAQRSSSTLSNSSILSDDSTSSICRSATSFRPPTRASARPKWQGGSSPDPRVTLVGVQWHEVERGNTSSTPRKNISSTRAGSEPDPQRAGSGRAFPSCPPFPGLHLSDALDGISRFPHYYRRAFSLPSERVRATDPGCMETYYFDAPGSPPRRTSSLRPYSPPCPTDPSTAVPFDATAVCVSPGCDPPSRDRDRDHNHHHPHRLGRCRRLQQHQALDISRRSLGEDHPDTASSCNNLAGVLQSLGRLDEAEPLLKRALEVTLRSLGPRHPHTATNYNNLGALYRSRGDPRAARQNFEAAHSITVEVLGPEHPDSITACRNLALSLQAEGRPQEAEELLRQAKENAEAYLGADHPDTHATLAALGHVLRELGRTDEAIEVLRLAGSEGARLLAELASGGGQQQQQEEQQEQQQPQEQQPQGQAQGQGQGPAGQVHARDKAGADASDEAAGGAGSSNGAGATDDEGSSRSDHGGRIPTADGSGATGLSDAPSSGAEGQGQAEQQEGQREKEGDQVPRQGPTRPEEGVAVWGSVDPDQASREAAAATTIQAYQRGRMARRRVAELRRDAAASAATTAGASGRGEGQAEPAPPPAAAAAAGLAGAAPMPPHLLLPLAALPPHPQPTGPGGVSYFLFPQAPPVPPPPPPPLSARRPHSRNAAIVQAREVLQRSGVGRISACGSAATGGGGGGGSETARGSGAGTPAFMSPRPGAPYGAPGGAPGVAGGGGGVPVVVSVMQQASHGDVMTPYISLQDYFRAPAAALRAISATSVSAPHLMMTHPPQPSEPSPRAPRPSDCASGGYLTPPLASPLPAWVDVNAAAVPRADDLLELHADMLGSALSQLRITKARDNVIRSGAETRAVLQLKLDYVRMAVEQALAAAQEASQTELEGLPPLPPPSKTPTPHPQHPPGPYPNDSRPQRLLSSSGSQQSGAGPPAAPAARPPQPSPSPSPSSPNGKPQSAAPRRSTLSGRSSQRLLGQPAPPSPSPSPPPPRTPEGHPSGRGGGGGGGDGAVRRPSSRAGSGGPGGRSPGMPGSASGRRTPPPSSVSASALTPQAGMEAPRPVNKHGMPRPLPGGRPGGEVPEGDAAATAAQWCAEGHGYGMPRQQPVREEDINALMTELTDLRMLLLTTNSALSAAHRGLHQERATRQALSAELAELQRKLGAAIATGRLPGSRPSSSRPPATSGAALSPSTPEPGPYASSAVGGTGAGAGGGSGRPPASPASPAGPRPGSSRGKPTATPLERAPSQLQRSGSSMSSQRPRR